MRPQKTYSKIWHWNSSIRNAKFSIFFGTENPDQKKLNAADCSWLNWRHWSGSSRIIQQSADYLVDKLQILSGSGDCTHRSKVLRQFIRNSTFIQLLKKYHFFSKLCTISFRAGHRSTNPNRLVLEPSSPGRFTDQMLRTSMDHGASFPSLLPCFRWTNFEAFKNYNRKS